MKRKVVLFLFAVFVSCFFLAGCEKKAEDPNTFNMDKDTSYAIGMYLAAQFQIPNVHYDYKSLMEGYRDYSENLETRFSMDEGIMKIQAAFELLTAREIANNPDAQANLEAGKQFLMENGQRAGVTTTASGLQYEVITQGTGAQPSATDNVRVHYEGTLIDGTVFDSSYARNEPAEFPLNAVIAGWTEGLQLMNEGSTYKLYLPAELGYGPSGTSGIPGNSTLIFTVELLAIIR